MARGVGGFDVVQGIVPESLAVVFAVGFALLTQFGDVWFVTVVLVGAFFRFDRDRIITVGGLVMGAFALVLICKYAFALPRPDHSLVALGSVPQLFRPVYVATTHASGYGFPSGHAVVSTVTYLSLAEVVPVSTRRRRYAGAVSIITVVSLSRVVLGVHYLIDVFAGVALGVGFLLVARRLLARYPDDHPTVALSLAVGFAAVSIPVTGVHVDALLLFVIASAVFGLQWTLGRPQWAAA